MDRHTLYMMIAVATWNIRRNICGDLKALLSKKIMHFQAAADTLHCLPHLMSLE